MGGEAPEACWATHKRQVINLRNCCILLVELFESFEQTFKLKIQFNDTQGNKYPQVVTSFISCSTHEFNWSVTNWQLWWWQPTCCLGHHCQRENCVLLGYYAASSDNSLPTFRDNLSLPFSKPGPISWSETSAMNCHYWLRNTREEHSSHLLHARRAEAWNHA
jgi:hypothetical protein